MKKILLFLILTILVGCNIPSKPEVKKVSYVTIDSTENVFVVYPQYSRINLEDRDFYCLSSDTNVILSTAAAFSGYVDIGVLGIAGSYVSNGKFTKGYNCDRSNGAFIWTSNGYKFIKSPKTEDFLECINNHGTAFCQEMMIHNGLQVQTTRSLGNINKFRALCEIDNKLCIVQAYSSMRFGDFIQELLKLHATEAIYLDMGGWDYGFVNDADSIKYLGNYGLESMTNMITFYK